MATEQGYSNQKKKGTAQFKTIHSVGSDAFGTISLSKSLYDISLTDQSIVSVSDVIGNDGQVKFWKVEIVAHGASVGNILRITSGTLKNFEFEVMAVVDADNIHILPISSFKPLALDTAKIMGWVTAKSDDQGNPQVSLAPAPVKFLLDGVTTDVSKDTVTPANDIALPVEDLVAQSILNNIESELTTLNAVDFATSTKQDTGNNSLSSIDDKIIEDGEVISSNSTTTPLGAGGVFTGPAFEILKYSVVNVGLISDVPSATNGVRLEVSPDGINWDHSHATTYAGGNGVGYIFNCEFKYARFVYTNGASAQSVFRLQTIVKKNFTKQSLYTIDQAVNGNMFVELGKNVIIGKSTAGGGTFVDVKVTPSGALTVKADVTNLPSLPAGSNNIGQVDLNVSYGLGSWDSGTQRVVVASDQILTVDVNTLPSGISTEAKQDAILLDIAGLSSKLDDIIANTNPTLVGFDTHDISLTTPYTFVPPVGAKRMIVQNSLAADGAVRFGNSTTPATVGPTQGYYLGVGQSTSEIPAGMVDVAAVDAAEIGNVTILWFA